MGYPHYILEWVKHPEDVTTTTVKFTLVVAGFRHCVHSLKLNVLAKPVVLSGNGVNG